MSDVSGVIAAFTEDQTERLTRVSKRQLRHWDKTDFFAPSIADDRRNSYARLYSFRDLVSLKVLNALRNEASVSLPHLREVKEKLAHLGEDIWAKTTLYVLNKKVVFDSPDGERREEVVSGQAILGIPLKVVTTEIEEAVRVMRKRNQEKVGLIEKHKNVISNEAVIAGTRIPVRSIKVFANAGYSVEQILREYPSLTSEDVKAALGYSEAA